MAEEEEVVMEVEAVLAVYGDDCLVLNTYPPHLHVQIKPRTADVSSQQFVEAVIEIKASPQYPEEPPDISIIDSKGLDEQRHKYLITCIRDKASELTSYLMLIALCEEAVEQLCNMNHPEGDCPLCLCPLVDEDKVNNSLPFMKLMSCFHCFHCECIIRWWNWLQMQEEEVSSTSSRTPHPKGRCEMMEKNMGKCPVCRKVFHAKDIEHVLELVGTNPLLDLNGSEEDDEKNILESDLEKIRRLKFETILKLQEENSGLIEPKKNQVLLPGMYLPRSLEEPPKEEEPNKELVEKEQEKEQGQERKETKVKLEINSRSSSSKPSSSKERNSSFRKPKGGHNSRTQIKQWIRKESE